MNMEEYQTALHESRRAGISLAPLMELEPSSWSSYFSQLVAEASWVAGMV